MSLRVWLHGLVAAFVGAFFGAIDSGIALMVLAPDKFNFDAGFKKLLVGTLIFATLSGIKMAAAYLKQSPIPTDAPLTTAPVSSVEQTKSNP